MRKTKPKTEDNINWNLWTSIIAALAAASGVHWYIYGTKWTLLSYAYTVRSIGGTVTLLWQIGSQVLLIAAALCPIFYFFVFRELFAVGASEGESRHIRGTQIISNEEFLCLLTPQKRENCYAAGTIVIPQASIEGQVFVIGAPKMGKTTFYRSIIEQLHFLNKICLIYTVKGEFIESYYDSRTDYIFNPLDARSIGFNLWSVVDEIHDCDSIAASLIPDNPRDPFWSSGAKDVFHSAMVWCAHQKDKDEWRTNRAIWKIINKTPQELLKLFKGTPGCERGRGYLEGALKKDEGDKMAIGVIAQLRQHVHFLEFMREKDAKGRTFNIEQFLTTADSYRGKASNLPARRLPRLFISNSPKHKDALKPILSLFIDLFSKALLSLTDSREREIHVLLDELGTLQPLSAITDLFFLGRSKGGRVWASVQDLGQLDKLYGQETRQTILNVCSNKVFFAVNEHNTAEYISATIGDCEVEELRSTESEHSNSGGAIFGSNSSSSSGTGTSRSWQPRQKRAVIAAEIQKLPQFHALVKVADIDHWYFGWTERSTATPHGVPGFQKRADLQLDTYIEGLQSREQEAVQEEIETNEEEQQAAKLKLKEKLQKKRQQKKTAVEGDAT